MPGCLKSLELQGYKTFATRTVFEYADMITAIVGPNGSGKSNIADSLRWVLGEQSFRLLRARKTEDMIFSGSQNRPRAGMASATVVFDNSDGWLPIDFTDVAVTRRAYRDGQNEYLINNQKVRLKDVSELLAESGLAERTYTIISQGLVDAALSLKAEERRSLFEEAAGIGLYRSRRKEATRRLEKTLRNIERVKDILSELRPRMRSLERQAKRAKQYGQVKNDLKYLLRDWYGYHWRRSQVKLKDARKNVEKKEEDHLRESRIYDDVVNKLTKTRERINILRKDLSEWRGQVSDMQFSREKNNRELAVIGERIRSINERVLNTKQSKSRLQIEIDRQKDRISASENELYNLNEKLSDVETLAEKDRKTQQKFLAERNEVKIEADATNRKIDKLNSRRAQIHALLSERQTYIERLRKELEKANDDISTGLTEVEKVQNHLDEAAGLKKDKADSVKEITKRLQEHQQIIEAEQELLNEAGEKRNLYASEVVKLTTQLDVIDHAESTYSGYSSGVKILLDALKNEHLQEGLGVLNASIDVPARLETAISAALGDFLDAIVIEDVDNTERALEILEKESARGVLVPLDSLNPVEKLELSGTDGVIGIAANLIDSSPDIQPAIDLLLGRVIIVENRDNARSVLKNYQQDVRIVTLNGDVFHSNGPILSGLRDKKSLLSRNREKSDLEVKTEKKQQLAAEIERKLDQINAKLVKLREKEQLLDEELNNTLSEEKEASEALIELERLSEKINQRLIWKKEQKERIEQDQKSAGDEVTELSTELEQIEMDASDMAEEAKSHSEKLKEMSTEEYQSEVSHWDTMEKLAEQKVKTSKERLEERQEGLNRNLEDYEKIQTNLEELKIEFVELKTAKDEQEQGVVEIKQKIKKLNEQIKPAEEELETILENRGDLREAEATARKNVSQCEHLNSKANINLIRCRETLESLRNRIEDDFGLVDFEYSDEVDGQTPLPIDGMVEQLPELNEIHSDTGEVIKKKKAQFHRLGAVNPEAQEEYKEVTERFNFLTGQIEDLNNAEINVLKVIEELDTLMEHEFRTTYDAVAIEFEQIFKRLFKGGSANLVLTNSDDLTNTGIDIEARLPGRRTQNLSLLSGGERSLTATALVFSLLKVSPTPFCLLDEVDAMLDDSNVGRFRDLLQELSENTQFIIVTHNRHTVQVADVIYGITMGRDTSSKVVSLKLDEVSEVIN